MKKSITFLSNNQLKIIAIIAMTCDHVSRQILPDMIFLQIIGRIAFPIFAYMIAEGCIYTKNRRKYLTSMAVLALGCQIFYYVAEHSLYQCVLVTFSLSIAMIYIIDIAKTKSGTQKTIYLLLAFAAVYFLTEILPHVLSRTDFAIDYGFCGVMFPVLVYMADKKSHKLIMSFIAVVFLSITNGGIQWYSLLALPLLALYNGKRGTAKLKYLFYIYYPLHLAVIYLISLII